MTVGFSVPAALAHPEEILGTVQYLVDDEGQLALSFLPENAKDPDVWTTEGTFYGSSAKTVEIPIANADPNMLVDESQGAWGWIDVGVRIQQQGGLPTLGGPSYSWQWLLVEGARTAKMVANCHHGEDPNYCDYDDEGNYEKATTYWAAFPGHEGAGKPHTHGDPSSGDAPLTSGDFGWLLVVKFSPCGLLGCSVLSGSYKYTISVKVDGTGYIEFPVVGQQQPEPEEAAAEDPNGTAGNTTDDPNATEDPSGNSTEPGGNSTGGNGTASGNTSAGGSGQAGSAFEPEAYDAQLAGGQAPGVSTAILLSSLAGLGFALRRRTR